MCMMLVLPDDSLIHGIDELDAAIGCPAPIQPGYNHEAWADRATCLCPVDFDALAKMQGWSLTPDDDDPMRLIAKAEGELAREPKASTS
jgi:hypothetical protein